jgi:hypothetical protein
LHRVLFSKKCEEKRDFVYFQTGFASFILLLAKVPVRCNGIEKINFKRMDLNFLKVIDTDIEAIKSNYPKTISIA